MKTTICGECECSTGRCSWSAKYIPVEGWEAIPTKVAIAKGYQDSYIVLSCPKYKPSARCKTEEKYIFYKGTTKIICVGREEAERFANMKFSIMKKALKLGHRIRGYEVEKVSE